MTVSSSKLLVYDQNSEFLQTSIMTAEPNFNLESHYHNFYHINFVLSGQVDVITETTRFTASKGTLFILPPLKPHSIISRNGYMQVGMDLQQLECGQFYPLLSRAVGDTVHYYNLSYMLNDYNSLFNRIEETTLQHLQLKNFCEKLLLTAISLEIGEQNSEFRKKLYAVLEQSEDFGMSVEELAKKLYISKSSLERYMHKDFAMSAKEYLNSRRISHIYYLLLYSDLKIEQIAKESGFYDTAHLITFFKKRTGLTPTTFRKNAYLDK